MNTGNRRLIYFLFFTALLPILIIRDFTPDNELRYLSIADEAIRNNHLFTFYNHGMPYADKPPLYLWIIMLVRIVLGCHQMWAIGMFSVIPAIITTHTMDKWVDKSSDSNSQLTTTVLLLTSGLFAGLAITLRMDMLMCMFIVLAMRSFWNITPTMAVKNVNLYLLSGKKRKQ